MKTLLLWLLNRLKERRTYIGLAWLLTVGGVSLRPDLWDQITLAGMALMLWATLPELPAALPAMCIW